MLERIWSGWRSAYVTDAPSRQNGSAEQSDVQGSVFTQLLDSGLADTETYIVHRGLTMFAIVNIHPYTSGHVLVVPFREVADLADLTVEESAELWSMTTATAAVVRAEYRPDGMNIGLNLGRPSGGSVPTHLHMHVVPRWTGDSNFMSTVANTQTLPEALDMTAARLRTAFQSHRGPSLPGHKGA